MRNRLKIARIGGTGFLYMATPISTANDTASFPTAKPADTTPPYSVPSLEIDFYSLDCQKLGQLIADTQNFMTASRLTAEAGAYYDAKLADMQTALKSCARSVDTTTVADTTGGSSGIGGGDGTGGGTGVTVLPNPGPPNTTPNTIVNIGDTSGMLNTGLPGFGPAPAGGAGGGGGGGSSDKAKAAAKKSNWWLWALAIGAFALALYKGRNTSIKMPG